MRSILITGGAGFIGSNFVLHFLAQYPQYNIINLDLLTYAGNLNNLKGVEKYPNYTFIQGDICNQALIDEIFTKYKIDGVIHFAAESHVDNSIASPSAFIETNVKGTFNLLHAAYLHWFHAPHKARDDRRDCVFHHISTDEVFGSLGSEGYFTESTPYAPNSPYSASKASSDMLVRAYFHTYGLKTLITNCSNNYGPKQHDEKLIPTIIRNAFMGKEIPIYGDGANVRDWLYVEDHCRALDCVFHSHYYGETFNIGGQCEKTNIEVANIICGMLDVMIPKSHSYKEQIAFVADRAGHDRRYGIDCTKIANALSWSPKESFTSGLQKTLEYYRKHYGI